MSMSCKSLHVATRTRFLRLPQPDIPIGATDGEQPAVRTPGQRVHGTALTRQRLHLCATLGVPEADKGITSTCGEEVPIRSKGETVDASGWPFCPQQGTTGNVPQFDRVIPAPTGQCVPIRAKHKSSYPGNVGLPDPVQGLTCLFPHPHFSLASGGGPVMSCAANGDHHNRVNRLAKRGVSQDGVGKGGILHLDPLQRYAAKGKMREIQVS